MMVLPMLRKWKQQSIKRSRYTEVTYERAELRAERAEALTGSSGWTANAFDQRASIERVYDRLGLLQNFHYLDFSSNDHVHICMLIVCADLRGDGHFRNRSR